MFSNTKKYSKIKKFAIQSNFWEIRNLLIIFQLSADLRIVATDISFTDMGEIEQPLAKYSITYSAKLKQMMAICEGFSIRAEVQENMYAANDPKASIKYTYSAPEDGFIVPSSAYASAPEIRFYFVKYSGRLAYSDSELQKLKSK